MQRPRNGDAATARDTLAEKRVAESNATVNHFLGATRRQWMIDALPSPGVQTKRKPPQLQPIDTTQRTSSNSVSAAHPNRSHTAPRSGVADLSSSGHNLSNLIVIDETARGNVGGKLDPNVQRAVKAQQRPPAEQYRAHPQSIAITPVDIPPAPAQPLAGGLPRPAFADPAPGRIDASSITACRGTFASLARSPNPLQHGDRAQLSSAQQPLSRPQPASTPRAHTERTNTPILGPWPTASGSVSSSPMDVPHVLQPYQRGGPGQSEMPNRPTGLHIQTPVNHRHEHAGPHEQDVQASLPDTTLHMPRTSMRLLPAPGYELAQQANPNPWRTALHQAYLRAPMPVTMGKSGKIASDIRLYQYLLGFALQPEIFDQENPLFSFDFDLNAAEVSKQAKQFLSSDYQTCRLVSDGCIMYRLRGIETSHQVGCGISESEWSVSKTCWPLSCFVRINDMDVELRRKVHYGRDIPVDLTPHIRAGKNNITVAFLRFSTADKKEKSKLTRFAMAVEKIGVGDQRRVDSEVTTLTADESLRSIIQHFASIKGDNDDVQVVDSHISIDLIDPFTAKIFDFPARGRTCTHRECFDLQTFLHTRKVVSKGGPTGPDEWKCPVCKSDARPQSLVIDGFLKMVRDTLVSSDIAAANDTKAILVGSDGKWQVKKRREEGFERASSTREGSRATVVEAKRASTGMRTASVDVKAGDGVVIHIDDD